MSRALIAIVVAAGAAAAEDQKPEPPQATPASAAPASATLSLPPTGNPGAYSAPGSLPPVSAQLFTIKGQTELQPLFMISLGDPFWRTLAAGVRIEHHFDERWSVSGHLVGGMSFLSAPIELCGGQACSAPDAAKLRSAPGKLQMLTGAEVGWAPVYGKLSLIGDTTLHFDAYVSGGPELVLERIAQDGASAETGRWAPGGRVSIGERFFISNRLTFRIAASQLVYLGRVRGSAEVERKLSLESGLTWFFGGGR